MPRKGADFDPCPPAVGRLEDPPAIVVRREERPAVIRIEVDGSHVFPIRPCGHVERSRPARRTERQPAIDAVGEVVRIGVVTAETHHRAQIEQVGDDIRPGTAVGCVGRTGTTSAQRTLVRRMDDKWILHYDKVTVAQPCEAPLGDGLSHATTNFWSLKIARRDRDSGNRAARVDHEPHHDPTLAGGQSRKRRLVASANVLGTGADLIAHVGTAGPRRGAGMFIDPHAFERQHVRSALQSSSRAGSHTNRDARARVFRLSGRRAGARGSSAAREQNSDENPAASRSANHVAETITGVVVHVYKTSFDLDKRVRCVAASELLTKV